MESKDALFLIMFNIYRNASLYDNIYLIFHVLNTALYSQHTLVLSFYIAVLLTLFIRMMF